MADDTSPDHAGADAIPPVTWVEHTASTQQAVLERIAAEAGQWPHLRALATVDQRAGRGRRGRDWTAPAGTAVSVSVVVRPDLPVELFSWVTLVTAAATAGELQRRGIPARAKWPNDVLAEDGRKLCGILASVLPDQSGLVLGLGLNLDFGAHGAPVPTATAMADWLPVGQSPEPAEVLGGLLRALGRAMDDFCVCVRANPGEVDGTHPAPQAVITRMATLGTAVRAHLADGSELEGTARGLGPGGTLLIEPADRDAMGTGIVGATRRGELLEVSAADVVHLRR
ncbi:biotin--[acetyl-CoA-carboxylase] ligase [Citricoccus sp.]|uniref:biotin--[acetyl-CoA-carboxylase] ligase n=1 Tax=Citricoccus sp. TaxID=1978372 RepID=UPI0026324706|nr:biotin--[acetyl-CoA-carboxylase] ligase [Citricoccus sp.]HRO31298.1 biotin--[acetyl-CoA-carboxylase] ligase [Citricoccus sp.]